MATVQLQKVLHCLRETVLQRNGAGLSDGELVEHFVACRDETAFAALVHRHGPMVLGVCRRVARHEQDAEDAFQATFLVLLRKAASLKTRERVGNWLYGVAYRTALKARASARRRLRERQVMDMPHPYTEPPEAWTELEPLLDQELNRLPDKYRLPVVLCELEGRTRREVARQLKLPEGTLSSRLATARKMLALRLSRRGVILSSTVLSAALSQAGASARVPAQMAAAVVKAATSIPAAQASGLISAKVIALTEGVLKTMLLSKLRITTAVLLVVVGALGGSAAFLAPFSQAAGRDGKATKAANAAGDRFRYLAYENFDGKLHLNWKPIRPDETHVSFTKNPGKLTITTQQGTIHADEKARNEPSARNIFVLDNPLAKDVDFMMTTSISSFTPEMAYQQAALIVYDDDDNYLKWSYEYNWRKKGGQTLCLVQETEAKVEHTNVDLDAAPERIWLRLTKRGNQYEFASSTDGRTFTTHGEKDWGNGEPRSLGILAKNGGPANVPEVDACFDFFELRAPAAR